MPFMNPAAVDNPYFALGSMTKIAPGITGHLVDEGVKGVYIITFGSLKQGKGNTGRFIDELKKKYQIVRFPNIVNPIVEGMLLRRGFKRKREYVPALKAHANVYVWKK
ncbi:hypothetical protein PP175_25355 (plasmid) [Aneurinibacillus sp. Ricciae_BoGa-3]|uniref:hypothetical protein n=1 Tax=Aneurinibacillus sp. Ricciae_BoGa-3 TaxID=3022697 RepID=UPI002341FF89|nr:hypothetical protein [Aneurinibacillus sp. Ricciae_BoGa-3]WCK57397.1 hypothetical protein PP175_25355 [Aneurinibacillus sp. Ricciae_BoGa-3]